MTPSSTQYNVMLVFILLVTHAIQLAAFYPSYYRTRYWSVALSSSKGFTLRMNSRIQDKSRYEESSDAVKLIVGGLTTLTNLFNSDADGMKDNGDIANRGVTSFTPKQLYDEVLRDFDNGYLFSGDINYSIYDNDCVFTDPTISFRGLSTFKRNIQSLQPVLRALLSDKLVVLYSSQLSPESNRISAKWRMSGGVNLPWRPRIELTGETQFTYNGGGGEGESPGLFIRDYYEQWDISAADALLQLLSPAGINSVRLDSSKTNSINVQKELSSLILTLQQRQPSTISTTGSPTAISPTTIFENEHFAKLRSHSKPLLGVTDSHQLFASGGWECLYDSSSFLSSSPSHQMTGRSMRVMPSGDSRRCSTGSRDDASAALVKSYSVLGYDVSVIVNMGISDDKQGDCFRLDVNQVEVSFGGTRMALLSDPSSIASWAPILRRSFSWFFFYPSTGGESSVRVRTALRVLYCDDDHRILQWNDDPRSISIFKRTPGASPYSRGPYEHLHIQEDPMSISIFKRTL